MFDVTTGLPPYDGSKNGSKIHDHSSHKPCPACIEGGMSRKAFPKRNLTPREYTYFGERISSDLCGPFPKSVDGFTYVICFIDKTTDISAIYLLKSKGKEEVMSAFESFLEDFKELPPP